MNTGSENQERSLREELSANLEEVQERARDESGRFARVEKTPEIIPDDEVISKPPEDKIDLPTLPKKDEQTKPEEEDPFPQSWKQDYKKHWGVIPKEVKDYIRQHEAETRKAMTSQDEDRLAGKSLREVINPYTPMLASEGVDAKQAISTMLAQHYTLRYGSAEQKKAMLLGAAKQFNIDLTEPASTQDWIDPQVQALQQELADMRGRLQSWDQSAQMQEKASIDGQIAAFGADPKHAHFGNAQVQTMMGYLMANGGASSMEEAYDKAIWSVAELRSTLLADQQTQEEAKRVAEAKAKADAARKASGSVRGSSGSYSAEPTKSTGNLREDLKAAMRAAKDRI